MERYQPELVPRALGLIKAMESKLSGKERNLREAFKAIDESEDKTEQAITEAKNASDKDNARMLWRYAFQIALAERKLMMQSRHCSVQRKLTRLRLLREMLRW